MKRYEKVKNLLGETEENLIRFQDSQDCCDRLKLLQNVQNLQKELMLTEALLWECEKEVAA
jgi:hypothetical protein